MSAPEARQPAVLTPVHDYEHPDQDTIVTLVGMVHFAQPGYYREVQTVIAEREREGATVHFEGVSGAPEEDLEAASRSTQTKVERLREILSNIYGWFDGTGLVAQTDELTYGEDWENHDVTDLELVQEMGSLTFRRFTTAIGLVTRLVGNAEPEARRRFALGTARSLAHELDPETAKKWLPRLLLGNIDDVILHHRNGVALDAVDAQIAEDPASGLVLVWGAKHLEGLGNGLEDRGFVRTGEDHLKAIDPAYLDFLNRAARRGPR